MIRRLLGEPVLHFLLIGVVIFVIHGLVAPRDKEGKRIVLSQGVVDALLREHQARWQRPPAEEELSGLVEAYVRDEILYREGTALGLDRDDPVIKRRVRQKFEVIAEEQQARAAATDADMAAYLAKHADRFTRPGTISFEQILLAASATAAEVEAVRVSVVRGANHALLGQSSMLPPRAESLPLDLAVRDFGPEFAAGIAKLPLNEWAGPVRSGFGLHLVRVTARTPAVMPALDDVRTAVAREWEKRAPRRVAVRKLPEAAPPVRGRDRGEADAAGRAAMNVLWQRVTLVLLLVLVGPLPSVADEFRPAYLQLQQLDAVTYDVLWKLPALDESTTLKLRPEFPPGTEAVVPVRSSYAAGTAVQRWRVRAEGGLAGKAIEFPNLAGGRIDVLVRVERSDGTRQIGRVLPVAARFVVTSSPSAFEVAQTYTVLGIEHILTGFDHLLFVLALVILVNGARRLIATVTAFTLAHSLTLFAATLGWIHIPGPPLEAVIALSIVFVAGEIVHARQGRPGLTQRYPWFVAFTFGLLHGLGFAGALAEVGLPPLSIPMALLFFNIGVEIGQLIFIATVLAVIAAGRWVAATLELVAPSWLWRVPPYAMGGIAGFWVVQRVAAF